MITDWDAKRWAGGRLLGSSRLTTADLTIVGTEEGFLKDFLVVFLSLILFNIICLGTNSRKGFFCFTNKYFLRIGSCAFQMCDCCKRDTFLKSL